jgi:hypothetical protein
VTVKPSFGLPINTKLGPYIHSWTMTAGDAIAGGTCPGESAICRSLCYAAKGFFRMPAVAATHARNTEFAKTDEFVSWMSAKLQSEHVRVIRVHVGGDFFDSDYIEKWREIVSRAGRTEFFAYTRSWRSEEMLPALSRLARYPNVHLWFSMDRATGPAPLIRGVRRCYLAVNDADAATTPTDCDLVFRDRPGTVLKSANGVLVCPTENGVTGRLHHTCSSCGLCWRKQRLPRWEQQLLPLLTQTSGYVELDAPSREVPLVSSHP